MEFTLLIPLFHFFKTKKSNFLLKVDDVYILEHDIKNLLCGFAFQSLSVNLYFNIDYNID